MTAGEITWYDVLGVPAGADRDTVRDAYVARLSQLRPESLSGAPSPVVSAAGRARAAVEAAWQVLSHPDRRLRYDRESGVQRGGGLRGSAAFGGPSAGPGSAASGSAGPGSAASGYEEHAGYELREVGAVLEALAVFAAPGPSARPRRLTVPDLRGLFFRSCRDVVTMAGLRLDVVRLTPDPMPVEGLVVGQSPAPGTQVRRHAALTVQVWHPPRHPPRHK